MWSKAPKNRLMALYSTEVETHNKILEQKCVAAQQGQLIKPHMPLVDTREGKNYYPPSALLHHDEQPQQQTQRQGCDAAAPHKFQKKPFDITAKPIGYQISNDSTAALYCQQQPGTASRHHKRKAKDSEEGAFIGGILVPLSARQRKDAAARVAAASSAQFADAGGAKRELPPHSVDLPPLQALPGQQQVDAAGAGAEPPLRSGRARRYTEHSWGMQGILF